MRISRTLLHFWQRRTRGFDDSETWSLDYEFQKWIVPRLKRFRELADFKVVLTEELVQAIDDMIDGFAIQNEPWTDDGQAKLQKAHDQFAKWHAALWW